MLAIFMAAVEVTIVSTAMPTIVSELGGFRLFSWVFAVYLLAQGVSTPLYGRLADLYGRKSVFVVGAIVFLIGSAACGFAQQMFWLVLFRAFQGLGAGSIQSIATTIVGDIYAADQRAKVQGWLSGVWGIAAIAGPALGAFIVEHLHWAYVFWINLPIGIAAIGIMIFCLVETVPRRAHRIDFVGAGLLTFGASAILVAVVQAGTLHAVLSVLLLAAGLIAFVFLFFQEGRTAEPMVPFQLWLNKIIAIGNIGNLFNGAPHVRSRVPPDVYAGRHGPQRDSRGRDYRSAVDILEPWQHYFRPPHSRDIVPNHRRGGRIFPYCRHRMFGCPRSRKRASPSCASGAAHWSWHGSLQSDLLARSTVKCRMERTRNCDCVDFVCADDRSSYRCERGRRDSQFRSGPSGRRCGSSTEPTAGSGYTWDPRRKDNAVARERNWGVIAQCVCYCWTACHIDIRCDAIDTGPDTGQALSCLVIRTIDTRTPTKSPSRTSDVGAGKQTLPPLCPVGIP